MGNVELPVVTASTPIRQVIETMRRHDTRAVLIRGSAGDFRLYMNTEVQRARAAGEKSLTRSPGQLEKVGSMMSPSSYPIDQVMDSQGLAYAVVSISGDLARVVTRYEKLEHAIRSAKKVCACSGNVMHTADGPPARDGEPCPRGDGTYECF